jgi:hypothetical protein
MPHKAPAITPYTTPRCIDCPCWKNWNGRQNSVFARGKSCSILHSGDYGDFWARPDGLRNSYRLLSIGSCTAFACERANEAGSKPARTAKRNRRSWEREKNRLKFAKLLFAQ